MFFKHCPFQLSTEFKMFFKHCLFQLFNQEAHPCQQSNCPSQLLKPHKWHCAIEAWWVDRGIIKEIQIFNCPSLSFDIETNSMRKCLLKLFSLLQKRVPATITQISKSQRSELIFPSIRLPVFLNMDNSWKSTLRRFFMVGMFVVGIDFWVQLMAIWHLDVLKVIEIFKIQNQKCSKNFATLSTVT